MLLKDHRRSPAVWVAVGQYEIARGNDQVAREVLAQALKALPKPEHTNLICKFAQFEFKFGSAERGRTIFETLVAKHPKRVDLWCVPRVAAGSVAVTWTVLCTCTREWCRVGLCLVRYCRWAGSCPKTSSRAHPERLVPTSSHSLTAVWLLHGTARVLQVRVS